MRKMIRRCLCAAEAVLLLALAGCSTQKNAEKKPESVTLRAMQYEVENQAIDFQDLWYFQEIEQQTGVHIQFEDIKDSEWETRLSLMFASGTYPDLILRGSLDVEEYGVSQHLVLPLDGYMDEGRLPNYTAKMNQETRERLTSSDGHIYQLGFLISQNVNTSGHFFINQSWLTRLGLSVPQTTDELLEVLRAFRDSDMNGNGVADEIPLEATFDDIITGVYNLFSFWGIPLNEEFVFVDEQGHMHFAPEEKGFLPAVQYLHTLIEERLLDVECITQGSNIWSAKINRGNTGMFSYWRLGNTALKPDVAEHYALMLPVHAEGAKAALPRLIDDIEFGAAISSTCSNVDAALRWLDAQFETENMLVSQNGRVGDTLKKREDGKYEVLYVPGDNELYKTVPVICGQFMAPSPWYESVYIPAEHRREKSRYCAVYEEAGVLESVSFRYLTNVMQKNAEESARISRLKTTLKSIIDQALVEFMTQGVDAERYARFLEELRDAGAEEYRQLYETIYHRWKGV